MSSFTSCNSSSSSSIWGNHNMCLRELLEVVASMHAKPLHCPKKTGRFSVVQAHIDFTPGLLEQRISRSWLTFFLRRIMEKSPRMISPPYWRQITSFSHRRIRNSPLHSLGGCNSIYKGSRLLATTPPASKTVHFYPHYLTTVISPTSKMRLAVLILLWSLWTFVLAANLQDKEKTLRI